MSKHGKNERTCMVYVLYYVSIYEVRLSIELISLCFICVDKILSWLECKRRDIPYSPLYTRNTYDTNFADPKFYHMKANSFTLTAFNLHPIKFSGLLYTRRTTNGPPYFLSLVKRWFSVHHTLLNLHKLKLVYWIDTLKGTNGFCVYQRKKGHTFCI